MFKNLALLFKIRAWLKSNTLQAGGFITVLGSVQVWLGGDDGMKVISLIANFFHVTDATMSGLLLQATGIGMLLLRAKTERGLGDK